MDIINHGLEILKNDLICIKKANKFFTIGILNEKIVGGFVSNNNSAYVMETQEEVLAIVDMFGLKNYSIENYDYKFDIGGNISCII